MPLLCDEAQAATAKSTARTSTQKVAAKTPAKKTAAKAAPTRKSSSAKTAAKKTPAKKTATKKAAAKPTVQTLLPAEERNALRERGINSGFGPRATGKAVRMHKGIDVSAPAGSSIIAFNDGEVIFTGKDPSFGNNMIILQPDGRKARYAHMQKVLVAKGEKVVRGQQIGLVGSTGRATGPHLHFELIENDEHVNPALHVWDSTELVLRPGDIDPREHYSRFAANGEQTVPANVQ